MLSFNNKIVFLLNNFVLIIYLMIHLVGDGQSLHLNNEGADFATTSSQSVKGN